MSRGDIWRLAGAAASAVAIAWVGAITLGAGALASITPIGASGGVPLTITGTGFNTTANQNEVTFRRPDGSVSATAAAVVTVNAAQGTRRITVTLPEGLSVGPASVEVRNRQTGEISSGATLSVVGLSLPGVREVAPGASVQVIVDGLGPTQFDSTARVTVGAGITIDSVSVQSPTRLTANITAAAAAALGTRVFQVTTSQQTIRLSNVFSVANGPVAVNKAPLVSAGTPQTITQPDAATLAGSVSDDGLPAGATVTSQWTQVSGPGTAQFVNAASPTTSVTFTTPGDYLLRLTATDTLLSASADVTITAKPLNQPPRITTGGNQTITLPDVATLSGAVTDDGLPAGAALTALWTQVSGPASVQFADAASPTTTVTFSAPGDYLLRLTATDTLLTALAEVTITVKPAPPVNQPPTVTTGGNQTITLPAAATLAGTVTDDGQPQGATVTSQWTQVQGPGTAQFTDATNPNTTVTFSTSGDYRLRLTATDTLLTGAADVVITVNPVPPSNVPPTVTTGNNQTITFPDVATLTGSVTDDGLPQGASVTSTWTQVSGPGTAQFTNAASPNTTVTFTAPGDYLLRLIATDTVLSGFAELTITVNRANEPPVVTTGDALTITLPAGAPLSATVTDDGLPTGAAVTSAWSTFSGPGTVTFTDASSPVTTATFSVAGAYVLRLTATDTALSAFADVAVTVNPPAAINQPPNVTTGAAQTITLPSTAAITGNATDDGLPQGSTVTTQWTQFSGPGTATFADPASASTTATFSTAGQYVLRLTATDGVLSAHADTAVTVNPPVTTTTNLAPIVTAGVDQTITLPASATLAGSVTDDGVPAGAAVTSAWSQVSGPGIATFAAASSPATTASFSAAGDYVLQLTASDTDKSASATLTVHAQAPAITNLVPSVDAGGDQEVSIADGAMLQGAVSDDGQPSGTLTLLWKKTSGPGNVTFSAPGASASQAQFTASGVYVLSLSASDTQLSASDDLVVVVNEVATAGDRAPPIITLDLPKSALPGARVDVRAQASDDTAVQSVTLEVDNEAPLTLNAPPFERSFNVPQFAEPGREIRVVATARDAAQNSASAAQVVAVSIVPDTESPSVELSGPAASAPGGRLLLVARSSDNVGVRSVTFLVDGVEVAADQTEPYEANYPVPAGASPGVPLSVVARAVDFAGNIAETSKLIDVRADADTTPPTVTLTVPVDAAPGEVITLSAVAADAGGVAHVVLMQGASVISTDIDMPYGATFRIPLLAAADSVITFTAEARDFAALTATDTKTVRVKAAPQITLGVITGEVFDDTTSLPVAGATVALMGMDAEGTPYAESTTTDERGRFILRAKAGNAIVRVAKDQWSNAARAVTVVGGEAVEVLDARLTPLRLAQTIAPSGGTLQLATGAFQISGGGLAATTPMRFATVGQQGLSGRLPAGWSPVAAADVWPHGTALGSNATLRVRRLVTVEQGVPIVLALWDDAAARWRALGAAQRSSDGTSLEATVNVTGQFAFLVADSLPQPPPSAVAGAFLEGLAAPLLPPGLATVITPQPQVLFYQPGVTADVSGLVTASAPVTSGALLRATITESYAFASGAQAHPQPFVEDLIAYQRGAAGADLGTGLTVSPSLAFDSTLLAQGTIAIDLHLADGAVSMPLVGVSGGDVQGPSGERLTLPPAAVSDATPIALQAIDAGQFGPTLPPGLSLAAAVDVQLESRLARTAVLSVPKPSTLVEGASVLLVRLQDIAGQTRLVLAGVGRVSGDRLVSDILIAGQQTSLEGVRDGGRYAFIVSDSPLGFAAGRVIGTGGAPFAGALISTNPLPVVSLSTVDGAYTAAGKSGTTAFVATDLARSDSGVSPAYLTAGVVTPLTLTLVAQPPRITSLAPTDGATNIPLAGPIVVTFSEPIDPATLSDASFAIAGPGGAVLGVRALSVGNTTATFRPVAPLDPNTRYTVTLSTAIADLSGYALAAGLSATFDSLDTTPPPPPPAGAIAASIPNAQGLSSVSGSQGTAGAHDRVFVDNLSTGAVAVALVEANGSFLTAIAAKPKDQLRVRIVDTAGNETVIDLAAFKQTNADGSTSQIVFASGGIIEGPEGWKAEVPAGAFDDGTVVTMKPVPLAQFPVPMSAEDAQNFPLVQAIQLDFGGAEAKAPLRLSIPAQPGDTAENQWIVMQAVEVNGKKYLSVADTAHFENGRIVDPPTYCPGVLAAAVYGIAKATQTYGLNYAQMYADGRYKLQAETKMFNAGLPFGVPYTAFSTILPVPVCFPVISGRVTVSPNVTEFSIPSDRLYLADQQVIIRNRTRETQKVVPRIVDDGPFNFEVPGTTRDDFRVEEHGSGTPVPVPYTVSQKTGQTVLIKPSLERIGFSPHSFEITNVTRRQVKSFTVPIFHTVVSAAGDINDEWELTGVPTAISGAEQHVINSGYTVRSTVGGKGNLVVRAQPGTIDPTRADAGDHPGAVRKACPQGQTEPSDPGCGVVLSSASGKVHVQVPDIAITDGGFAHAFEGEIGDTYSLTVYYENRPPYNVELPRFTVQIINTLTNQILKTILGQSPPRDTPLDLSELVGFITDDLTAPFITDAPAITSDLGADAFLSFTFSKPMNAASLKANVVVKDAEGNEVAGEIRVSNSNRTVTFVPRSLDESGEAIISAGFTLGQTYTLMLKGSSEPLAKAIAGACEAICDAAGNLLQGVISLPVSTFGPKLLQVYRSNEILKDVGILRKKVVDPATQEEQLRTFLFTPAGQNHLLSFDVTDVSKTPLLINTATSSTFGLQRITVIPNANVSHGVLPPRTIKDLAVVAAFNVQTTGATASFLDVFDVSDPEAPASLARDALTYDGLLSAQAFGAVSGVGYAKGVAGFLVEPFKPVVFSAVERSGLFGLNIASRVFGVGIPGAGRIKRGGDSSLGGHFTDVAAYGCGATPETATTCSKVVAIKREAGVGAENLVIAGADLSVIGSMQLGTGVPRRVRVVERVPFDLDRDGVLSSTERLDLAFVGTDKGIQIALLGRQGAASNETFPRAFGNIPINGSVYDLEIDPEGLQLFIVFESLYPGTSGSFLGALNVSAPNLKGLQDSNKDGIDDRLVFRAPHPGGVNGMRLDTDRQLLYIAGPTGLYIYKIGNVCCDMRVDMTAKRTTGTGPTGSTADVLAREKLALKTGIVKGLARAAEKCGTGFEPEQMKIWESGSSACLWTDRPDLACGSNYQPGLSDHDLSTFMPDEWYLRLVPNPDKTSSPKDKRPEQVPLASCVVQSLTYPFTDPDIGDPELAPRGPEDPKGVGFRFADISFLPNYTADLTSMRYRLARTMPGIPGDSDNTLGLGMQGLILKHLTEAHGVSFEGVKDVDGYQDAFERVAVPEQEIQQYLLKYRTDATVKIPTIEGYEWANLMEYQLRKAYTAVRIRGADNPNSQFHDLFVSQTHLAGKAGIRAALGRLSAVPATRDLILNFRRDNTDTNPGPLPGQTPLTLRGAGASACLQYVKTQPDPTQWPATECTGMEHYVASVAVRALGLQESLPLDQQMFTVADVRQVFDFYLVKADDPDRHIDTDKEADDFIAATFQFVLKTKQLTEPEYLRWINPGAGTSTHPIDATPDPDQLNDGARDPEGVTTTRGQRRVNNIARKNVRMGDKAKSHLHIVPHVFNRGVRTVRDIKVGMYYTTPGAPQQQHKWTQLDTGNELDSHTIPKIGGGEHIYPEWQLDSDGTESRTPSPNDEEVGKTIDLFELEVDQATAPKGVAAYVAFTVDLPDRHLKEANRRNNFDGFWYYVLDAAGCAPKAGTGEYGVTCETPAGTDGKVPFPLSNPLLLAPDTECDLLGELTITQRVEVGQDEFGHAPISLNLGQQATLLTTITNTSDVTVDNIRYFTTIGSGFELGFSLAPGESHTFSDGYKSDKAAVAVWTPSLSAPNAGFIYGAPFNLLTNVCGPGPALLPMDPNVNPTGTLSRVMRNGRAVRYFQVINTDSGQPMANVELKVSVPGLAASPFTFVSNAQGKLGYMGERVNPKGETVTEFIEGVGIPFVNFSGVDGSEARVFIDSLGGEPLQCRSNLLFTVFVDPLEFTYDFEAGGAISAGVQLFKLSGDASIGGSYRMRLHHRGPLPRLSWQGLFRLDWERKTEFGFETKFGFKGFSAEQEFDGKVRTSEGKLQGTAKAEAFKFGGEAKAHASQAYRYTFPAPSTWGDNGGQARKAFVAVLFPSLAEADEQSLMGLIKFYQDLPGYDPNDPNNKLFERVFSQLFEPILAKADEYKIYRAARIGELSLYGKVAGTPFNGTIDFAPQPNETAGSNPPVAQDQNGQTGKAATPSDKADSEKEEEAKPAFKASSSFDGQFDMTYEFVEQLKHEIGDPVRAPANPNAVGEKVIGVVHTLTFDTKYNYKADFATNLDIIKKEIDTPNKNYPQEPKWVKDRAKAGVDWLAKRIAGSDAAAFDGGLQFRVFSKLNAAQEFEPWRLEITFRGPKAIVASGGPAGDNTRYSLTFAVEGKHQTNAVISEILLQAQAFRVLLGQMEEQRVNSFLGSLGSLQLQDTSVNDVSPKTLYLWFFRFVKAVLIYGGRPNDARYGNFPESELSYPEFYEEVERGKTDASDFGLGDALKAKFSVTIKPFELDSHVRYRISRGSVVRGQPIIFEDYAGISIDPENPVDLIKAAIKGTLDQTVASARSEWEQFSDKLMHPFGGGKVSTRNTSLDLATTADAGNTTALLAPTKTEARAAASAYGSKDNVAPAGKPHYGLGGGFRIFERTLPTLDFDQPGTLALSYSDDEVVGFAESTIRMYRWEPSIDDWALVPAVLDTTANTVTATIAKAGMFTLGAIMPAGKIAWTITGVTRAGSADAARTVVSLESAEALRMNDGTPAPAGTLVHVRVFNNGGGDIVSADASGALDGIQVAVDADGKVRVQVSLPGNPRELNLGAFSDIGTVDGTADIPLPQP